MKLYEFVCSWEIKSGTQIAYVKCNAKSLKDAEGIIHMYVPFHIDLGKVASYEYSKSLNSDISLWYFDANGKEHHNIYKRS